MKENSQLSSSFTYIFHKIPIKDIIIGEPLSVEQVPEMKIYVKTITMSSLITQTLLIVSGRHSQASPQTSGTSHNCDRLQTQLKMYKL